MDNSLRPPLPKVIEIFDSAEKAWKVAGDLPRNLIAWKSGPRLTLGTAFSGGYFYCLMSWAEEIDDMHEYTEGIMGFNMLERTSIFVPVPNLDQFSYFYQLLACGSRILYVVGSSNQVTIWEVNKDAATNWRELVFMPQAVYEVFTNMPGVRREKFTCAGMGNWLYFRKHRVNQVAVYNLTQNSWTLLSSCPTVAVPSDPPLIVFKPNVHMKVS